MNVLHSVVQLLLQGIPEQDRVGLLVLAREAVQLTLGHRLGLLGGEESISSRTRRLSMPSI